MVKSNRILFVAVVLAALASLPLLAASPKYDPSTEVTLQGEAVYVAEHPSHASWTGIYAIMRDSGGEIEVHLAPSGLLNDEGVVVKRGQSLKVVGSRVRWNGTDIILAREVTANGKTAVIRDKDGKPRW